MISLGIVGCFSKYRFGPPGLKGLISIEKNLLIIFDTFQFAFIEQYVVSKNGPCHRDNNRTRFDIGRVPSFQAYFLLNHIGIYHNSHCSSSF